VDNIVLIQGFPLRNSTFSCQCHSSKAPYSYSIYELLITYNHSNRKYSKVEIRLFLMNTRTINKFTDFLWNLFLVIAKKMRKRTIAFKKFKEVFYQVILQWHPSTFISTIQKEAVSFTKHL
jgi:hypothetical protein